MPYRHRQLVFGKYSQIRNQRVSNENKNVITLRNL